MAFKYSIKIKALFLHKLYIFMVYGGEKNIKSLSLLVGGPPTHSVCCVLLLLQCLCQTLENTVASPVKQFATNVLNSYCYGPKKTLLTQRVSVLLTGIVSKSFECRLKGQGATYVEAESQETEVSSQEEPVQQVIIIQGYGEGDVAIDQALEQSAAATLQTLAMAGQVAEVLHITEDGQVIASGREVASAGAHLVGGATQYVVLESGEAKGRLQAVVGAAGGGGAAGGEGGATGQQAHVVSESSTALDALLSAVSEMGHQEEVQEEAAAVVHKVVGEVQEEGQPGLKQEEEAEREEVHVIQERGQEGMQEVLQLAASQMMKEGLTQVIVNDEGTHYIVTELDNCTLQVEENVYATTVGGGAGEGEEAQQEEPQVGEEMVVYVDGAEHNIVLEG